MRGRKKSGDDVAALDKALKPIEQGLDYVPPDVEQSLQSCSLEELHGLLRKGCTLASVVMAQKGWVLMMVKRKVGHGNFKNHLKEITFDYSYANKCMKVAYAIGRHPGLAQITDTNLLRKVVYLPDAKQAEIEIEITRVNRVDKTKERFKELTPWLLDLVAMDLKAEANSNAKTNNSDADAVEQTPEGINEQDWMRFLSLHTRAQRALIALADVEIKPEWYDRIFGLDLLKQLATPYNKIILNFHPQEEVNKRRILKHVPGFGN